MAGGEHGSLTKEPPLATLDATIRAITPGMAYDALLTYARANTHRDAPGLLSQRFLLNNGDGTIAYDHFLSISAAYGLEAPLVRKVMYFLWAYRDDRIRRFVCERIADKRGVWRTTQLLNKANSDFFEQWLQPSTARKARSNFEYFLVETKIFDPDARELHLELSDGWLQQAAIAAAQHERDPLMREHLLRDPVDFLEKHDWLGLLNSVRREIPAASSIPTTASAPREDEGIKIRPPSALDSSEWNRNSPSASGRQSTTANVDLVARERANRSHYLLVKALAHLARQQNHMPKFNQNIDMHFETPTGVVLVEIKSCTDTNFHSQLRKGVSQLLEYRFLYRQLLGSQMTLLLLMETTPPKQKRWLSDYLLSIGIMLAWKGPNSETFFSTCDVPRSLDGIVAKVE